MSPTPAVEVLEALAGWARPSPHPDDGRPRARSRCARESSCGDEFARRCAAVRLDRGPVEEDPNELKSELGTHAAYEVTRRRPAGAPSGARTRPALCPILSSAASSDETFTVTFHPESIKTENAIGEILPTTVPRAIVPPEPVAPL